MLCFNRERRAVRCQQNRFAHCFSKRPGPAIIKSNERSSLSAAHLERPYATPVRVSHRAGEHLNKFHFPPNGACRRFLRASLQKWNARLVSVFADDRARAETHFISITCMRSTPSRPFILRAGVAGQTEFTSLTNAVPAVNWQERNPRSVWPETSQPHNPLCCACTTTGWKSIATHRLRPARKLPPFKGAAPVPRSRAKGVQCRLAGARALSSRGIFSVAGEPVLYLQLRLFYVHKGAKLFEPGEPLRAAGRDLRRFELRTPTAFCHAVERVAAWKRRRARSSCARSAWNWSASTITSPTSVRLPRRGLYDCQHAPCG